MFILSDESTNYHIKVVGAISINLEEFFLLDKDIYAIRFKHKYFKEFKWNIFSSESIPLYSDIIKAFFKYNSARFHSNSYLKQQDQYKVSYKLIETISWKLQDEERKDSTIQKEKFFILFDENTKGKIEVEKSHSYLKSSRDCTHTIECCHQCDSKLFNLMQLTDLFTGSMSYKINLGNDPKCLSHEAKKKFISELEKLDQNLPLNVPSGNIYQRWNYYERKIQHYNLHLH